MDFVCQALERNKPKALLKKFTEGSEKLSYDHPLTPMGNTTVFMMVARHENPEMLDTLLNQLETEFGEGSDDSYKQILEKLINQQDSQGRSSLHFACKSGNVNFMKKFLGLRETKQI